MPVTGAGWAWTSPDPARGQVEPSAWLAAVEYNAGYPRLRMPQPHISDSGLDVVIMAGEPFCVGDVAELHLECEAAAARNGDRYVTAPPSVVGPGLYLGCGSLLLCPPPQQLFTFGVPQGFRVVPAAGRRHPGRVREVGTARSALSALRDERHPPWPAGQVRTVIALPAHQRLVAIVALAVPLPAFPVTGMHFLPGRQVQADHEKIIHHSLRLRAHGGRRLSPAPLATELAASRPASHQESEMCGDAAEEIGNAAGHLGARAAEQTMRRRSFVFYFAIGAYPLARRLAVTKSPNRADLILYDTASMHTFTGVPPQALHGSRKNTLPRAEDPASRRVTLRG